MAIKIIFVVFSWAPCRVLIFIILIKVNFLNGVDSNITENTFKRITKEIFNFENDTRNIHDR